MESIEKKELLDLNDLEFTSVDYKDKGPGLRKWILKALEYHPNSYLSVSKISGIKYITLLNFINGKSSYMNYSNMFKLRSFVNSLITIGSVDSLEKDQFFEG